MASTEHLFLELQRRVEEEKERVRCSRRRRSPVLRAGVRVPDPGVCALVQCRELTSQLQDLSVAGSTTLQMLDDAAESSAGLVHSPAASRTPQRDDGAHSVLSPMYRPAFPRKGASAERGPVTSSFPRSERFPAGKASVPGPGAYDAGSSFAPGVVRKRADSQAEGGGAQGSPTHPMHASPVPSPETQVRVATAYTQRAC